MGALCSFFGPEGCGSTRPGPLEFDGLSVAHCWLDLGESLHTWLNAPAHVTTCCATAHRTGRLERTLPIVSPHDAGRMMLPVDQSCRWSYSDILFFLSRLCHACRAGRRNSLGRIRCRRCFPNLCAHLTTEPVPVEPSKDSLAMFWPVWRCFGFFHNPRCMMCR